MQQRPDLSRFREIPAFSQWRQRDLYEQVANDLRNHDYGYFYGSAALVDEMMTDDRISGVLNTRIGGFLSVPTSFRQANGKRKSLKLAETLGGAEDTEDDGIWPEILSQDSARELLKWRIMLGVAVAEIVWETTENAWTPRIIPVHPRYLRWDWVKQRFILYMYEPTTTIELPETQHQPRSDGKWIVWGGLRSWMNGAVRALGTKYLGRQWNDRDWLRYNEKHGLPAIKGKMPSESNAEEKDAFRSDLNNMSSEPTILCPQQQDGVGFDVEWMETSGQSTGGVTFHDLKSSLDSDIAILLLGQNLTTEMGANGAASGSRAGGEVHNLIRIDKKREDAGLYTVVRQQVLTYWAGFTSGDPELAPYPTAQVDPPDDEAKEAQTLNALGDAGQKLKTANPRTDLETIWETYGIPQLDENDPKAQPPEPPPQFEGPGAPGFHAFGADGTHIAGPHPTKEEARAAGEKAGGSGPVVIKQQQAREQQAEPPEKRGQLVALSASTSAGKRQARYKDALTNKAARRAAVALGPLVERINSIIETSSGPDDLKRKLVAMYRHSRPNELAKVFERTNILANLAGRHDLILEL